MYPAISLGLAWTSSCTIVTYLGHSMGILTVDPRVDHPLFCQSSPVSSLSQSPQLHLLSEGSRRSGSRHRAVLLSIWHDAGHVHGRHAKGPARTAAVTNRRFGLNMSRRGNGIRWWLQKEFQVQELFRKLRCDDPNPPGWLKLCCWRAGKCFKTGAVVSVFWLVL